MDFCDILKNRRSVRHFSEKHIENEVIQEIIQEAAWAPSPGNTQPWKASVLDQSASKQFIEKFEISGVEFVFPVIKTIVRRKYSKDSKPSINLNQAAVDLFIKDLKVSGSPRVIVLYHAKRSFKENLELILSSISLFKYRAFNKKGISNKVKFMLFLLRNLYTSIKTYNTTIEAALSSFMYALCLAAYNKGLSTCIQYSYTNIAKDVSRYLNLRSTEKYFGVIMLGYGAIDSDINTNLQSNLRKPVDIKWVSN